MKKIILIFMLLLIPLIASDKLIFGSISIIEPHLMKKKLAPFIEYLEKMTGKKIEFRSGYDYGDSIEKFANGTFDIGLIGPSPYTKVKKINPNSINIVAGLKNKKQNSFKSVIISKKGSPILTIKDLDEKNFAFGSPESTLSYYLPMNLLIKQGAIGKLKSYDFLGRHDRVAQYVIMGKYDAGAVKKSIADKYSKYVQVITESQAIPDFMIVANSKLDKEIFLKIQDALYKLTDPIVYKSFKANFAGFEPRKDSDYDKLRVMMQEIDDNKKVNIE